MSDFNQPLESHEQRIFERLTSQVLEVHELVQFSDMILARQPVYGERGEMLEDLHVAWLNACQSFVKSSEVIYNSLAQENYSHYKRQGVISELKKAARLGF